MMIIIEWISMWRFTRITCSEAISQCHLLRGDLPISVCQWRLASGSFDSGSFDSGSFARVILPLTIYQHQFYQFSFASGDFPKVICQCQFALKTVSKDLEERIVKLEISWKIETMHCWNRLEYWEESWKPSHSDSCGRSPASADVKSSHNR